MFPSDLEGARHANLGNKHDLVIKSHYKFMFTLTNTFQLVLQRACKHPLSSFITEPFMSMFLFGRKNAISR